MAVYTSNKKFFRHELNALAATLSATVKLRKTLTFKSEDDGGANIYIWLGTDTKAYEDEDGTAHAGRIAWFGIVNFAAKADPNATGLLDDKADLLGEQVFKAMDAEPATRTATNSTTGKGVVIEQIQTAAIVPFVSEDLQQGGLQLIGYLDYVNG